MTLMPVVRISISVDCSVNSGAERWIGSVWVVVDRAALVDRFADHVDDAAERGGADRDGDRGAGIGDFLAAGHAVGRVHGDGADLVLAEMLRDFEHQRLALVLGAQGRQDGGQIGVEAHVDDGAQDLRYRADIVLAS